MSTSCSGELKKWMKLRNRFGWIIHSCVLVFLRSTLLGLSKLQFSLDCSRNSGSSEAKHWPTDIAVWSSRPQAAELFPSVNETPLYTSFYYHPLFALYDWNTVKQEAHGPQRSPELHFIIAIICFLDWYDDSCMLDLKLHNSTRGPMVL